MSNEPVVIEQNDPEIQEVPQQKKKQKFTWLIIVGILALGWILVRPGVFTVQPIGALPEGVTIIYHSRNSKMPFFSSPDGMCLDMIGKVSLLCRATALSEATAITERIILKLPYSHFAYLQSTHGAEFEN